MQAAGEGNCRDQERIRTLRDEAEREEIRGNFVFAESLRLRAEHLALSPETPKD